ncbi:TniQ family protein [Jannaschia rubra]|uniref:TniQ family protein n=1 Tax=Jannaschia rubra TaxID=282197 RepID=UPI00248F96E7|nr:TniQ family protein [Jannaschia rubra]
MSDVEKHERQLGLTVTPFPGETPASIVSRIAARNGIAPRDLCSDLGLRWPFLCTGYPEQLSCLADLTGLNLARLERWNPEKIGIGRYRVGRTRSSTGVFRRTATRVCPACIEKALERDGRHGAHQLLEWSVMCLHGCEHHKMPLVELPRAATSHETYDVVAQIARHSDVVKKAADAGPIYAPTAFEAYVRRRINHGPQADWLNELELSQLHGACLSLGAAICGSTLSSPANVDPDLEREFCVEGLRVLADGPDGLTVCMEGLKSRSGARRPYISTDLGAFYVWLRAAHGDAEVQSIIDSVHSFAVRNYTMKPKKRVLGRLVPDVQRMSFETAREQSGLSVGFLKRLVRHVDNLSKAQSAALTETTPDQLSRAIDFWGGLRNLKYTAVALNVRPAQVKGLIEKGILRSTRFGTALRYVFAEDVGRLLADTAALPELPDVGAFLPLRDHCRNHRIGLVRLITHWQEGKVGGFARGTGAIGLQAIHVPQDVDVGARDTPIATRDLTPLEAAAYLKIGVGAIRALRDAGYLDHTKLLNVDTNHRHSLITKSSIREFEARFLTLGQLAASARVAPIHLARQLDSHGVPTVICGRRHVRAYERSKISEHELVARRISDG